MSKKVVVLRYEANDLVASQVKERVSIVDESIEEIYERKGNLMVMKYLIELERKVKNNPDIHYELDLVEESELALENFNNELNGKLVVKEVNKLETFLVSQARDIQKIADYKMTFKINSLEDIIAYSVLLKTDLEHAKASFSKVLNESTLRKNDKIKR